MTELWASVPTDHSLWSLMQLSYFRMNPNGSLGILLALLAISYLTMITLAAHVVLLDHQNCHKLPELTTLIHYHPASPVRQLYHPETQNTEKEDQISRTSDIQA
jgi:hypothetical protein